MWKQEWGIQAKLMTWFATAVCLSAIVGWWSAEDVDKVDSPPKTPAEQIYLKSDAQVGQVDFEKIEATLAQAGCPGWMVVASEGESILVPPEVKEVSSRVPRVKYPNTLRIASRQITPWPARTVRMSTGSPEDPDDLLDGMPDLIILPNQEEETPPAEQEESTTKDTTEAEEEKSTPTEVQEEQEKPNQEEEADGPTIPQWLPPLEEKKEPLRLGPTTPLMEVAPPVLQKPAHEIPPPVLQDPAEFVPPPPLPSPRKESPFQNRELPRSDAPHSTSTPSSSGKKEEGKTYCEYIADCRYPSAEACAKCHEQIYDEWRVSSHAYAAISPMFHKFEQKINDLSQGTIGYFCYRCHLPVGTNLGISRAAPLWDYPKVVREGVTCVACHRINERFGKVNGERRIEPGSIHAPVYGSIGGGGIAEAIARKNDFKVKTSPHDKGPGQDIHVAGYRFDQLGKSEFCVSCHQVAVHPGIKLEVVWEQYRASPACKKGISCQDCHMGRLPGVPSGYAEGAAAKVNGKVVNSRRKHANHIFYGPGYSIAHPGIFPHNTDADRWSMRDWLTFDWRAGWGTEEFEKLLDEGRIHAQFPKVWAEADDRFDARDIIDDNLEMLQKKKLSRQQVMENGSHVDGPYFDTPLQASRPLRFHYIVTNTNEGHNLPSGSLGAQPQLWANVVLIGPRGQRLWESGYTDRYGDVADIHSEDVRNKRIPYDHQLFNLQTMFLITGAKGTDREFFLPVNVDFDQLPYLRPGAQPITTINHPPFIRMEGRSLAPLGSRKVPYKVPAHLMCEPGRYRLSFRLRSRAEPIYFMRFCDSTQEMQRAMNEWIVDFHQSSVEFIVR